MQTGLPEIEPEECNCRNHFCSYHTHNHTTTFLKYLPKCIATNFKSIFPKVNDYFFLHRKIRKSVLLNSKLGRLFTVLI